MDVPYILSATQTSELWWSKPTTVLRRIKAVLNTQIQISVILLSKRQVMIIDNMRTWYVSSSVSFLD